ncbi:hypothetical protein TrST_g7571 [Triparma strigata]|uniref:Dynein heavy chain coiled coil stalk domain-containing protein n=1 Tax=Triparma strigata TaxID=1606541 RepID=A0A9W7EH37_9STRA|nr:hypothetical protein TrST_g7571 [Triparma strigata]
MNNPSPAELFTKECGWNESQFKPGIPEYDATFDPACGYLRRNKPNAAMKLLKKSTSTGKPIPHRKLRQLNDRAGRVGQDVMNNPFKDELREAARQKRKSSDQPKQYAMSYTSPAFASVAAAFDFEHHDGTDPALELNVLKSVLIREGLLGKLWDFAERANTSDEASMSTLEGSVKESLDEKLRDASGVSILQVLTQFRDITAKVCINTVEWRDGSGGGDLPRPFLWHGENYILKMCDDVDFLSECDTLVSALKVEKSKMIGNPLMLPNTLQEEDADAEALDATVTDSKKKKERQVLRAAEKILRLEVKFKDAVEAASDSNFTNNNNNNNPDDGSYASMESEQSEDYEGELMSWYDKAQAQLLALSEPISGYTKHKSRNLGDFGDDRKQGIPGQANFQREPENHYPQPRRLTEILAPQFGIATQIDEPVVPTRENTFLSSDGGILSLIPAARSDFGETTYTPNAVPPPVSKTMDRAQVVEHARRKSTLAPKGPQNVQSRLFESKPSSSGNGEPAGLKTREGIVSVKNRVPSVMIKKKKSRRGKKPPVITAGHIAGLIDDEDVTELRKIENPKDVMAMVAAAVVILLSPGKELPKDVSWAGFKKVLADKNFVTNLVTLEAANLSGFKARALNAYLMNNRFIPAKIAKVSVPGAKLAAWCFVTLKNCESFEWPESLALEKVLEGMEEHLAAKKPAPKPIKANPKPKPKAREVAKAKEAAPPSKPVAKVKTNKKTPKNQQAPKDVGSQLYSGTREIGGGKLFFISAFDTHSKSSLFVKAYDPATSEEYRLTVPMPATLSSQVAIENYAKGTLINQLNFVPARLSNKAYIEFLDKPVLGSSVAVAPKISQPKKVAKPKPKPKPTPVVAKKADTPAPAPVKKSAGPKPMLPKEPEKVEEEAPDYFEDDFEEKDSVVEEKKDEPIDEPIDEPVDEPVEDESVKDESVKDESVKDESVKGDSVKDDEVADDYEEEYGEEFEMGDDEAATKLQKRARVSMAKKRVAKKREEKEQNNAALKLQGRARIRKAKKRVKKIRDEKKAKAGDDEDEYSEEDYEDEDFDDDFEDEE